MERIDTIIEELKRQNDRLAIINQIAKSINVETSYEEIIDLVAEPLRSVVPYDLLSFCLIENDQLIIRSGIPKDEPILGKGWILDNYNSAPWKAIREKRCFLRQDIWNDPHKYQEDDYLQALGIRSAIMSPLLIRNEVIGALNFGSKNAYAYSENDFVFVQQLADQLAVCIHNSRLFREVSTIKAEWELTFQAVPDRMFMVDAEHRVLRHNKPGVQVPGAAPVTCSELFGCCGAHPENCPSTRAFETGLPSSREVMDPCSHHMYDVHAYPVPDESGRVKYVLLYVQDITARLSMERQLFQSAKLAAIGEMAAGVAHELNSPLTAIIGNSELLLLKTMKPEVRDKLLEDIKTCGQRSKRIIQNLLTFSRQDSYAFEPLQIHEVVRTSLSLVAYQISMSNIQIVEDPGKGIPPLMGNKQQLEQVIINLILNARDALEGVPDARITLSTAVVEDDRSGQPAVAVRVTDNGCGIPLAIIDNIFNPFFTTKEKSRGTGLGLSVSLGIAQTHGGRILVESSDEKGSQFTLIVPLGLQGPVQSH